MPKQTWLDHTDEWIKQFTRYNVHPMKLRRGRACLLVIDMQNEFLKEDGAVFFHYAADIVPNVKRILAASRKAGIPAVFTGHVHNNPAVDGGLTARWWPQIGRGESLRIGTRGVQIARELRARKDERVVWKHRYSAFYNTDLELILRGMRVSDLIITGVLTNVCCESTARDAFYRDFRVFFVADATATTEPELQAASLKSLAYAFAYIVTTEGIVSQMR